MSIDYMRRALCSLYHSSPKWVDKVSRMHDRQVFAVYMRMLREGYFGTK